MCTVLFAWQHHPDWPPIVAANRDDAGAPLIRRGSGAMLRRVRRAGRAQGRDLARHVADGRFAAVTNVREPRVAGPIGQPRRPGAAHLMGRQPPRCRLASFNSRPYNVFVWRWGAALGGPNHPMPHRVRWRRACMGRPTSFLTPPGPRCGEVEALREVSSAARPDPGQMFALLADRTVPPDEQLQIRLRPAPRAPAAPIFIDGRIYGTRASTVVMVRRDGLVHFEERRFQAKAEPLGTTVAKWWIRPWRSVSGVSQRAGSGRRHAGPRQGPRRPGSPAPAAWRPPRCVAPRATSCRPRAGWTARCCLRPGRTGRWPVPAGGLRPSRSRRAPRQLGTAPERRCAGQGVGGGWAPGRSRAISLRTERSRSRSA